MYCSNCGKEIPDESLFCPECGANQEAVGTQSDNSGNYSDGPQPINRKRQEPFLVQSFNPDFSSFSSFVSSVRDQQGISEASSSVGDPYEYNVPIVPDCVQAEENEKVVKQYNIARLRTRLKFMKAEGRLMVTNRRVLFRAAGTSLTGNLLQEHEFDLDELAGIEIHKDYKFSMLNLLGSVIVEALAIYLSIMLFHKAGDGGLIALGVIFGMLGIVPTIIVYKHPWIKLLFAGISVISFGIATLASYSGRGFLIFLLVIAFLVYIMDLIIVCFVPNLVIKIKVKGAHDAVNIGSQKSLLLRHAEGSGEYSGFVEVLPWEDTIMAMNEIGALIDDLKKHGDYAIEKWTK